MISPKSIFTFLIILVLFLALKLLLINVNKPFWGHHDWNSVVYSNIARNYVRYGFLQTKLGQVTAVDIQPKSQFTYISHYPPLLPIFLAISFELFGQSEVSARLVIIFFSLLLVFSIYKIGEFIHSRFFGLFAAVSLIITPIFLYFGKLPVHDTIVPAISAFGFWMYLIFKKTKKNNYYYLLVLSIIIGGLVNWTAYYLIVALAFHQFLQKEKAIRIKILMLIPLAMIIFLIQLLHLHILGVKAQNTFSNVLERINPYLTKDLYNFSYYRYFRQEISFLKIYYTLPLFLASILFFPLFALNFLKKNVSDSQKVIIALFVYGIIQLVLFQQLSFIHDYMIYYLAPFIVFSSSYFIFKFFEKLKNNIIFPFILIFILFFGFASQLLYVKTLLATNVNKRGYDVGNLINSQTKSGEKSLITSTSYKEFQEVFISYYSDRVVFYGESLPENFAKDFTLVIRPKDHDPLNFEDKQMLDQNYRKFENDQFIWYKIN